MGNRDLDAYVTYVCKFVAKVVEERGVVGWEKKVIGCFEEAGVRFTVGTEVDKGKGFG